MSAQPSDPMGFGPAIFGFFVVSSGLLVLSVWYFRLLAKYRKAFRQAAAESRASVLPTPIQPPMIQPPA